MGLFRWSVQTVYLYKSCRKASDFKVVSASDFKVVIQVLPDGLSDGLFICPFVFSLATLQDLPLAIVGLFEDSSAAVKLVSDFADFYKLCKSQEFSVRRLDRMDRYDRWS